jgi:hypothetical protein
MDKNNFDNLLKEAFTEHAYKELAELEAMPVPDGRKEPPMGFTTKTRHRKSFFKVAAVLAACVCFFVGTNSSVSAATNEFVQSFINEDELVVGSAAIQNPKLDGYNWITDIGTKLNLVDKGKSEDYIFFEQAYSVKDTGGKVIRVSFDNGQSALITKKCRKGDAAHIGLYLNLTADYTDDARGENVIIGYYKDGIFTRVFFGKMAGAELNVKIPEDGEYMFYVCNASSGTINMDEFSVRLNADNIA